MTEFTRRVIDIVKAIPEGTVMTYGDVARAAGNPRGARAVSYILHSSSEKYQLPWHRVIGKGGKLSLDCPEQKERLVQEGIVFDKHGKIVPD